VAFAFQRRHQPAQHHNGIEIGPLDGRFDIWAGWQLLPAPAQMRRRMPVSQRHSTVNASGGGTQASPDRPGGAEKKKGKWIGNLGPIFDRTVFFFLARERWRTIGSSDPAERAAPRAGHAGTEIEEL